MSTDAPRKTRVRDTRILETREEISLIFGAAGPDSEKNGRPVVDSATRIILTPSAAKRLLQVLRDVISRHESAYGVIDLYAGGRRRVNGRNIDAACASAARVTGADRLIMLLEALGVHYGLEHSFKIIPGTVLGDRVLLGFNRDELGGDASEELLPVLRVLNMPPRFQKIFREHLDEANILLFGYEGAEGGGVYKAYLEFGSLFDEKEPGLHDIPESFLLHLGFKWDAADNRKTALARYTCYPLLSPEDILKRVRERFYPGPSNGPFDIVRGFVEKAGAAMRPDEFLYLEVAEENNPRLSYDINMYRANLALKEFYSLLSDACDLWGVPRDDFQRLYEPMKERYFGHVSGGLDREGRDFLTFYYGVKGSSR